jgi:hypothetical protein
LTFGVGDGDTWGHEQPEAWSPAERVRLFGKEHFAIDGCKLPSNASKKWSGTHKELEEKSKKLERVAVAERIVERHRERDAQEGKRGGPSQRTRVTWERMNRLIDRWLPRPITYHPYPLGPSRLMQVPKQSERQYRAFATQRDPD